MNAAALARVLGGKKSGSGWVARCVGHDDSEPSLSIRDGDYGLLLKCFAGCTPADVLRELRRRGLLDDDREHARRHDHQHPRRHGRHADPGDLWQPIWRETIDLKGSPAEAYLIGRLGRLPADLGDLRYHSRCPRGRDRLPALVALMRDAVTNEPTGIHRTFVKPDGSSKADVQPAKMMMGRAAGSVVKLTPDENVTLGLGLSEGIEDGLAIINSDWRPIWTCLSAGSMAAFPVLNGLEALTVFADADSPGRKAAAATVERWRQAGKEAAVAEPPDGVKDFGALNA